MFGIYKIITTFARQSEIKMRADILERRQSGRFRRS